MAKNFEVLRTCRGSIAMTTIYVVMFGITVYEYMYLEFECANMQSYVNIRCYI